MQNKCPAGEHKCKKKCTKKEKLSKEQAACCRKTDYMTTDIASVNGGLVIQKKPFYNSFSISLVPETTDSWPLFCSFYVNQKDRA